MNKFQNLNFNTIGDFLDHLPESELKIVEELRRIVFECIPDAREKLSYNVPFFSRKRRICFIWPASVPWGNVPVDGVQFGFTNGYLLNDDLNYLDKGSRKQVYTKTFYSIEDIDAELLRSYLFEALSIDDNF